MHQPLPDYRLPITAHAFPATWEEAGLNLPGANITPFSVTVALDATGDYRIYTRVTDRAGNRLPESAWYVGTTFVNLSVADIPGLSITLDAPRLFREGFLRVAMAGTIGSLNPIQHLRVFDGERWTRLPLTADVPSAWTLESNIHRSDQRLITFRAVARDGYGNVAHAVRTVVTDTLVARPALYADLPSHEWATDITPTLVVTWPTLLDAGGPVSVRAEIDTFTDTVPTMYGLGDRVSRVLDTPGVWYAHVRVVDAAGNQRLLHDGPYGVNRTRTPSVILPDGWLDFYGGEYPVGTRINYDPYAADEPALLLATWDDVRLYLGFTGADWDLDRRFVVYFDTRAGGSTASLGDVLPGGEPVHTLPFAADYALAVSGVPTWTLFAHTGAGWASLPGALSFAVTADGLEIVFDRAEIGATEGVPVSLLAYVATDAGVTAVLPAGARPSTADVLEGPLVFNDAIHWTSLSDGFPEELSDLPVQWIAPLVSLNPGYPRHFGPGDTGRLAVTVTNPDVLSYRLHPLTVTLGGGPPQLLEFVSLDSGAVCVSCPANGSEWVVTLNVPSGEPRPVVFTVRALSPGAPGKFVAPVTATLAYQGLPVAPQPPAVASFTVDNSVAQLKFAVPQRDATIFARPGLFTLPIIPSMCDGSQACQQEVSVNRGAGWETLGALGALQAITATLPVGYNQLWQVQIAASNGQTSMTSVTIRVDSLSPVVQIMHIPVLTQWANVLKGTASDDSGWLDAVQVSLNGGRFQQALLLRDISVRAQNVQGTTTPVDWAFPINTRGTDGEVVVRAVDAAGNMGPASEPVTVTLDATGPAITVTESLTTANGTVTDGSGVGQVQISLDGGASYQTAMLNRENWSFDYETWTGGAPVGVVVIRAIDVYGNVSQAVALTEASPVLTRLYLPVVLRQAGP